MRMQNGVIKCGSLAGNILIKASVQKGFIQTDTQRGKICSQFTGAAQGSGIGFTDTRKARVKTEHSRTA